MKAFVFFIFGVIFGCMLTISISNINVEETHPEQSTEETFEQKLSRVKGVTLLTETESKIKAKSNKIIVFQSLEPGFALANIQVGEYAFDKLSILLVNRDEYPYYDDQEVIIPKSSTIKQIGIYKYTTKLNTDKTVPIVEIVNNNNSKTSN